ncbi:hypothetical protein EDD11_006072 [Mortierella claussenii]|nr:hypothetical protein EDD11_006072 [Mortierella claussenii]
MYNPDTFSCHILDTTSTSIHISPQHLPQRHHGFDPHSIEDKSPFSIRAQQNRESPSSLPLSALNCTPSYTSGSYSTFTATTTPYSTFSLNTSSHGGQHKSLFLGLSPTPSHRQQEQQHTQPDLPGASHCPLQTSAASISSPNFTATNTTFTTTSATLPKTTLPSPDAAATMGSDHGRSTFANPCADGDFIVRALHEYHTDSIGHLSFSQFQYIKVKQCEESGWWLGESENNRGWFPSNRVERVASVYEDEITSEDYDQIRTGLDGVETQFLGEPMAESVSDSMQMDWGVANSPSIGWNRPGQLAFPPNQFAESLSYYSSDVPSAEAESDLFYQQTMSSTLARGGINSSGASYAYSDFVAEVALYVTELREAALQGEIERYQPIVANIISCVKALLIFTNTIARESEILESYPELARSRRDILRALGKLYSKCRVANGSQARTTSRQRQFAVEKLGIFGGQVLTGITEFAAHARDIGLRIMAETSSAVGAGLDTILKVTNDTDSSPPASSTHVRTRRRVSRVNSAKGYKSFNAVRQWKVEHQQKYSTARRAVELLLEDYMEYLNGPGIVASPNCIMSSTVQSAHAIELFLFSAEEMKTRGNAKEDGEHANSKAQLTSALSQLLTFIQTVGSKPELERPPAELVVSKLMSIVSVLLKCLVDMEGFPKSNNNTQEIMLPVKRASISEEYEPVDSSILSATHTASTLVRADDFSADREPWLRQDVKASVGSVSRPSKSASSRNTASLDSTNESSTTTPPAPLSSSSDSSDGQPDGNTASGPKTVYGEGNDLDRNHQGLNRTNHDSAVGMSVRNTPHHSLVNGPRGANDLTSVAEEEVTTSKRRMSSASQRPSPPRQERRTTDEEIESAMKSSARVATEIFIPHQEASILTEETIAFVSAATRRTFEPEAGAPPTPTLNPLYTDAKTFIAPSRSPRLGVTATDNAPASRISGNRLAAPNGYNYSRPSADMERVLAGDQDFVGLGVSVPAGLRSKSSSSSLMSDQGSLSGSGSGPRASPIGRARSPTPAVSPSLEPSKRMPRSDYSPRPNSPSLRPESKASGRSGTSHSTLSPSIASGSRRGSQASIRSDVSSGRRRSNDSQLLKENDSRQEQQQPQQQQTDRRQLMSQTRPRRGSNNGSSSLRADDQTMDEGLLSGPMTPTTPHIQTFVTEGPAPRRPGKSHRRESVMSNVSVATENGAQTLRAANANLRPTSPAMRSRTSSSSDDRGRGRVSTESMMSDRSQAPLPSQHQQTQSNKLGPQSLSYRQQRQNKVGHAKAPLSGEYQQDTVAKTTTTPWYLENDYEADEVLYNDSGVLVAATLEAYIEILTSHKSAPEPTFVSTFFLTFRLFTNPVDLVRALVKRFNIRPPADLANHELLNWQQQKQERVQKRVHIAIKTWLEGYWVSEKDRDSFKPILEFVTQDMMEALPGPSGRLLDMLNQWVSKRRSLLLNGRPQTLSKARSHERINQFAQEYNASNPNHTIDSSSNSKPFATVKEKSSVDQLKSGGRRGIVGGFNRDSVHARGPPVPLVNKALLNALANDQTMSKVVVTEIKPVELARQLTIMVSRLFLDIPYLELFEKERPNCSRMVQVSTKITIWVTDTIVDEQDVKKRIGVVKHWIEVGEECLKLNNFDTLTAISFAIESTPVRRLHNTWEGISKSYIERSLQLRKMISNEFNYSVYRAKLKTVQAPCIPFLGLYFTVIAYIEDGNSVYKEINPNTHSKTTSSVSNTASSAAAQDIPPNTPTPAPAHKLLRYGRFAQLAKAVQEFRDFQGVYDLLEVPRLHNYIMKCMENQDSERSWRKSLAIEPRRPTPGSGPGHHGAGSAPGSSGPPVSGGSGQRSSAGGASQRSSGGGSRGLFHGGNSSMDGNNGVSSGGSSMPAKLNKFFRKSTRSERS